MIIVNFAFWCFLKLRSLILALNVPNYFLSARHNSLLIEIVDYPQIIVVTGMTEWRRILFRKHIGIKVLTIVLNLLVGLKMRVLPVSCLVLASLCLFKSLELTLLNLTL